MNTQNPVLFESALEVAIDKTKPLDGVFRGEIFLVRDLRGRIRVVFPDSRKDYGNDRKLRLEQFSQEIAAVLGAYGFPPDRMILFAGDLVDPQMLTPSERRLVFEGKILNIYLLDRQIIGQDWMRSPLQRNTKNPRFTFFGIKGGVGRSTALIIWAWRLARQGKRVLVFDFDLESPGSGSTLLPKDFQPDYGIVDWFVEDGVGQAEIIENSMVTESPLTKDLTGEIRVVPAYGRDTGDYLPKLARCYAEWSANSPASWAERVQRIVQALEDAEKPDLVVLDSRAGLHDIAAVLVTRMDADALLFAVGSPQTWMAYSFLFKHWKNHPQVRDFRQRLQVVAGMVPETGREEYLKQFRENSWDVFRENLYDEADLNNTSAFSFDLNAQEAPHYPLPVFWHRALQEFNPAASTSGVDAKTAEESLGLFMAGADHLLAAAEERES